MRSAQMSLRICAFLAVSLLFGSRWFSYIGLAPIFISDVLFAAAIISWLFSRRKNPKIIESRAVASLTPLFALLLSWSLVRGVFSLSDGYQILDILRDLVPFLYISIALLVSSQIKFQSLAFRSKLNFWIYRGLALHLIWCLVVVASGNVSGIRVGPFLDAGLFSFRADIDTALVVVLFVLSLKRWIDGSRGPLLMLTLGGCLVVVTFSPARSSLIALLLCLVWVLSVMKNNSSSGSQKKGGVSRSTLVSLGLALGTVVLVFTTAGSRLLGGLGFSTNNSDLVSSALGTTNARELVWTQVLTWVNNSTANIFFGAGFGINFLDVTQTLQFLEGTTYKGVRSPHNFLITIIARLGWPAAILFAISILIIIFRFRKASNLDDLNFASMTIVLAFIPISLFGVILEAPFGAIPFYFCVGILLGDSTKTNKTMLQARTQTDFVTG